MKKIVLIIVLVLASVQSKAQNPEYDTVVFHPYVLDNCPMSYTRGAGCLDLVYNSIKARSCDSCIPPMTTLPGTTIPCQMDGAITGKNQYGVQGVAQPYHFDSTVHVIGIATKIGGTIGPSLYNSIFFRIMDTIFNDLDQTVLYLGTTNIDSNGYRRFWFGNDIPVKDFYLSGDIPSYQSDFSVAYPHSWSLYDSTGCLEALLRSRGLPYDTIFVDIDYHNPDPWATVTDTLIACRFDESPWLKKDYKWIRFADDPVYNIYQKTFIEILPILKVRRADSLSLIEEINIDNTCNIFPNPAENVLNLISQYKVSVVEIYNTLGVKVKGIEINNNEARIDISNLSAGNYIVKIFTNKGIATKKFVIN